jgi:ABC-type sulfate/molybdate transport systems ATPase subunit
MLKLLQLEGYGERSIARLSGGQKQRVALGRALAVDPSVLLLDEPMSNLDYRVRLELRHELRALQQRVGITAIYVTHDREEALTLADRIAVIDAGRIAQLGTPDEVFHRPVSPFVAGFMGADNAIDVARAGDAWSWPRGAHAGAPGARALPRRRATLAAPARAVRTRQLAIDGTIAQRVYLGTQYPLSHRTPARRRVGRGPAAPRRRRARARPRSAGRDARVPGRRLKKRRQRFAAHHVRRNDAPIRLRYASRWSPPARCCAADPDGRADDAQRRHRRRPEHGRLRQQLTSARSSRS